MILVGYQDVCCEFLRQHSEYAELPEACRTFGIWADDDTLVGAVAFHHCNEVNCFADIALLPGVWARGLLRASLWYAFEQLKLRRLTFVVAASNLQSIGLVEKLGAYREATLQDGCLTGAVYIYCLRRNKCPKWSKLNG